MVRLKDSQIWESERCVIQIQTRGKAVFDFMAVIFQKSNDGILTFNNVMYNEDNRIEKFIEHLKMKEVKKKIVTRKKNVKK